MRYREPLVIFMGFDVIQSHILREIYISHNIERNIVIID